ncbi:MAG: site-specific integrase [Nannocystis sp.]|nr:site-specific integrase [Nannocystis sp.]
MKINLRPYTHDHTRWHVDIRLMHPATQEEIRKRLVAPAGLSEAQARTWGERQVPAFLGRAFRVNDDEHREREARRPATPPPPIEPAPPRRPYTRRAPAPPAAAAPRPIAPSRLAPAPAPRPATTLAELYAQRFEPEYARLQKPATQAGYEAVFRNYIGPALGALPLAAIDDDRLSSFRAGLRHRYEASTCNFILAKLAKMLRFARKLRLIDVAPEVEMFSLGRARPKAVLADDQIVALLDVAGDIDPSCELVVLLALDAGLRCSEICALEWSDIDFTEGSMIIQHNTYRGAKQTPKGSIGKIALTAALRRALDEHRQREPIGPLVLYRRSKWTHGEWRPFSPNTVRYWLNEAQRRAGLPESGPHLLRHTALTRLAKLGASVYVVQAVARHTRLQTTQTYIHTQQIGLVREAADLLDRAAARHSVGKNSAKSANSRQTRPRAVKQA